MTVNKTGSPEISMKNTKQEMLAAYHNLLKDIESKQQNELKPEKEIQTKKKKEVLSAVTRLSMDGVVEDANKLKLEIARILSQVSDKLETEVNKLHQLQEAIDIKEQELKEIYDIDRSAGTLVALIEAQNQEREKFVDEMVTRKEDLRREIESTREQWKKEKEHYEAATKEHQASEAKDRKRDKEEYEYSFQREKELAKDQFEQEKAKLIVEKEKIEIEMTEIREQTNKELSERQRVIAEKEKGFELLQGQVSEFPNKIDCAVADAIKAATEKLEREAKYQKDLIEKQFEGEKNVLTVRIESLQKTVKEQNEQISKLSQQQELAYQKVQDVAVKAIDGASKTGSFGGLQQVLAEQSKRQAGDN